MPFPPGGGPDILARLISPKLTERLRQQIIVENRAGANGMIGMDLIAHATPDGYTIGVGQAGNMVVAPHTYKKISYDPLKDFAPVAVLGTYYLAVVSNSKSPFSSMSQMINWAKSNSGKLSVATNGEGGFPHFAFEQLRGMAGFSYTHVPYKGSSQVVTDVIGGQVQAGIGSYASFSVHLASGRLRLLGVTNPVRVPGAPEMPIIAETVPGYDARGWFGVIAPAATPREIVGKLNDEINRALRQPDVAEKMNAEGLIAVTESPEFFGNMIRSDFAKYGKLVREIGFRPQ